MNDDCVLHVSIFGPEVAALKRICQEIRQKYNIPDHQIVRDEVFEEHGFTIEYDESNGQLSPRLKFKSPEAKTFFLLTQL